MSRLGAYAWLEQEPGPRILREALRLFGVAEADGGADNPTILSWANELGLREYEHDETAWCGLFVAICAKRAGYPVVRTPLWALSWAKWGIAAPQPMLGDLLVFHRKHDGEVRGHVGFYVGEDVRAFHVYGGNQSNQVCVTRVARGRLVAARRCRWKLGQPANVRAISLATFGAISDQES